MRTGGSVWRGWGHVDGCRGRLGDGNFPVPQVLQEGLNGVVVPRAVPRLIVSARVEAQQLFMGAAAALVKTSHHTGRDQGVG